MIGFLKGIVKQKLPGQIILLVGGIGYLVTVPASLLLKLKESVSVELYIYTHHKEDTLDLYGFPTPEDLNLFKLMMTVSGIGPKTAILVIDQGVEKVEEAIKNADIDFFTSIPRLGRKNAQKIIIELKNKLGGSKDLEFKEDSEESKQAIEALRSMGYTKQEAVKAVKEVPADITKVEQKISYALKHLGQ